MARWWEQTSLVATSCQVGMSSLPLICSSTPTYSMLSYFDKTSFKLHYKFTTHQFFYKLQTISNVNFTLFLVRPQLHQVDESKKAQKYLCSDRFFLCVAYSVLCLSYFHWQRCIGNTRNCVFITCSIESNRVHWQEPVMSLLTG